MADAKPGSGAALVRRGTVRLAAEFEIDATSDHNFFTGFALNLSEGGLFIASYEERQVGDRLLLNLKLPDLDDAIEAKGEVRWVRLQASEGDPPPGFGVRFLDLDDRARAAIEHFISSRDPIFYDD
ncbi:MAG: hypothetical protein NVSMB1_26550 [Polyangiales bacterium]